MQITLSTTNWLARYYHWIRGVYPTTLCPYFWSMIIFIILCVPITIIKGAIYLIDHIPVAKEKPKKIYTEEELLKRIKWAAKIDKYLEIFGKILAGIMIIFFVFMIIFAICIAISEAGFLKFIVTLLALIGGASTIILLGWMSIEAEIFQKIGRSMIIQVPAQAISGAYHKMCPRIN